MMHDDAPKISDFVMDRLIAKSGLYMPNEDETLRPQILWYPDLASYLLTHSLKCLIVGALEHAGVDDVFLTYARGFTDSSKSDEELKELNKDIQYVDRALRKIGDSTPVIYARSLIGSLNSRIFEGIDLERRKLETECSDANSYTGNRDRRLAVDIEKEIKKFKDDIYLENLDCVRVGADLVRIVEELEESKKALLKKALKHFNNAISIRNNPKFRKRNDWVPYRLAGAVEVYLGRYLVTGENPHYMEATAHVPRLQTLLEVARKRLARPMSKIERIRAESDCTRIENVLNAVAATMKYEPPINPLKHS